MKVREAMTSDVSLTSPTQSIREAARLMAEQDIGALPVGENDRLIGMVTDRDIAVRAVAKGLGPDTKIRDVMSQEVMYCFDDEDLEDAALNMGGVKVRRLPVLNRDKRLVGSLNETHLYSQLVAEPGVKSQPVELIMQPAFPFVDVSTPVELLATMITPANPAVLVRDFKTDKTFIITRSDVIRVLC